MDSETFWFFFILIGLPILFAIVLKFLFGKAPPPKPDQEISDELFDDIEHTSTRRRRRKRSRNQPSSDE